MSSGRTNKGGRSMAKHAKAAAKPLPRDIKTNTDTGLLKLIAIATMLVDHLGARVFPQYHIMRVIGRLAFPIFAYCIAVGCCYTRNIFKYALRVLALALLVQPLYTTAMGHQAMRAFDWANNYYRVDLLIKHYYFVHPCILFSLFLGICLIATLKYKKYLLTGLVGIAVWYVSPYLDYNIYGIMLMVICWALLERPGTLALWLGAYMIWYGIPTIRTRLDFLSVTRVNTQFFAIMALPLLCIPTHTNIKVNKYVFYAFYPAHLILIYLLTMNK